MRDDVHHETAGTLPCTLPMLQKLKHVLALLRRTNLMITLAYGGICLQQRFVASKRCVPDRGNELPVLSLCRGMLTRIYRRVYKGA